MTMADLLKNVRSIIPTYNAERYLSDLIPALLRQGLPAEQFLIIDSSSTDGTAKEFRNAGFEVLVIPQRQFNHGGTRRLAAELCSSAEYLIFGTHDAIPSTDDSYVQLLSAFKEPAIGLVYGRQLPRPAAGAIERHARLLNYPAQSEVRSLADRSRLGIKTVFCSDSFAAYRRSALMSIGNFPQDAFFAEDQIVAGRMLLAGYKIAYVAQAEVTHSHGYSTIEDFKRYFDVGIFHGRNAWLKSAFGQAEGAGLQFVRSEISYVLNNEPTAILSVPLRTAAKYIAYRLGQMEKYLPLSWKRRLSMSPYYWR